MNKKIFSVLLALIICLCLPTPVFASDNYDYDAYVFDNANLLSSHEEQLLYNLAASYADTLQMDIVFLTYDDANGKSTMAYTDDYYDGLEGDYCYADDGILFAIDMDNREIYINTVGLAIRELDDNEIDAFLDYGYDKIVKKEYYDCLEVMAKKSLQNIQSGETLNDDYYEYSKPSFKECVIKALPISIILGLIVMTILLIKHNRANKQTIALKYLDKKTFKVNSKNAIFAGTRTEIKRGYYKQSSSSSRSSGGSSHRSSSGRSHGGGGRRF